MTVELRPFSWQRMIEAVEAVRERAIRATAALKMAGVPYALAGDHAVATWVARVDKAAVRNTRDVDILIRRADFDPFKVALESGGFIYHEVMDVDCFIDGPKGSPRDAVHILYVTEIETADDYDVVNLQALLTMKLNSFRDKARTHIRDMISVGLIDATWLEKLPPQHASRLQQLLDDPEG